MTKTIRWNAVFGAVGFFITFLISLNSNLFMTSFIRGIYAFVIWFALAFVVRFALQLLASGGNAESAAKHALAAEDDRRGAQLDVVTPDETEDLHRLLKQQPDEQAGEAEFTPLQPPKLVKKAEENPEQIVRAIRHLTEE
ncbi:MULTISPECIES: hypothetical protein [unclassified Paenibacillus]|uniref:hypothetical protein n=1 Tax=unclassified Paenibacillus TaxID=185978 RepID=UPI001C128783|nr:MULTISPECIES: hypothetical protein [unclassified Paenibacillus]MBU5441789.1 hypothetical protein [Paenibacillus sp. MSJ-34]CAH0119834.1 hypothetical protein PAE9249_02342 [Paenibacillus sp. CECT 9249]